MKRELGIRVVVLSLLAALLLGIFLPLKSVARVTGAVLRVHVVANSDSAADQETKLAVRDRLLSLTGDALQTLSTVQEAESYLRVNRGALTRELNIFLKEQGVDYDCVIEVKREGHAAKTYEDITLPAGEYRTVRVTLGAGEGKNFFCVLFPPLCRKSAEESSGEILADYGVSGDLVRVLTADGGREVRFRVVDFFRSLFAGNQAA